MDRIAYVYYNDRFAGILSESDIGYQFVYDNEYIQTGIPIAYHFPFSQSVFFNSDFFPFFENLLSEGWMLHQQSIRQHIDEEDAFGLLLENGGDLTGSVTVLRDKI